MNRSSQNRRHLTGAAIALAVAGMFAADAAAGDRPRRSKERNASTKVRCAGINECRGKGECAGKDHVCAGHNACKGKGWISVPSEKACTDKGGKVVSDSK